MSERNTTTSGRGAGSAVSKASILGREPVMWMALVQAALAAVVAFGLELTPEQIGVLLGFSAAVLGFIARQQVTPVETP